MELLVWSHIYSVGDKTIDDQHRKLMQLLNDLHNVSGNGNEHDGVNTVLDELVNYTVYHFSSEENMFRQHGYPYAQEHEAIHKKLVSDVQHYIGLFKENDTAAREQLMVFLTNWLKDHILGDDKKFGKFLEERHEEVEEDL